jgi:hypothetical protein
VKIIFTTNIQFKDRIHYLYISIMARRGFDLDIDILKFLLIDCKIDFTITTHWRAFIEQAFKCNNSIKLLLKHYPERIDCISLVLNKIRNSLSPCCSNVYHFFFSRGHKYTTNRFWEICNLLEESGLNKNEHDSFDLYRHEATPLDVAIENRKLSGGIIHKLFSMGFRTYYFPRGMLINNMVSESIANKLYPDSEEEEEEGEEDDILLVIDLINKYDHFSLLCSIYPLKCIPSTKLEHDYEIQRMHHDYNNRQLWSFDRHTLFSCSTLYNHVNSIIINFLLCCKSGHRIITLKIPRVITRLIINFVFTTAW